MRKLTLVAALAAMLALVAASAAAAHPFDRGGESGWRPYVLDSPAAIAVPAPPAQPQCADACRARDASRPIRPRATPARPSRRRSPPGTLSRPSRRGRSRALALIAVNATSTAKAQRVMALVHVAMHDATAAAWYWKRRDRPPEPGAAGPGAAPVGGERGRAGVPVRARRPRRSGGRGAQGPAPG